MWKYCIILRMQRTFVEIRENAGRPKNEKAFSVLMLAILVFAFAGWGGDGNKYVGNWEMTEGR